MNKLLICLLWLVCLAGICFAQAEKPTLWQKFTSVEGRFQIMLPALPKHSTIEVFGPAIKGTNHEFAIKTADLSLTIIYGDNASQPAEMTEEQRRAIYDRVRDGYTGKGDSEVLVSERDIHYGGQLGREMTFKVQKSVSVRHRLVLSGVRFYQLVAIYSTAAQSNAATQNRIDRFMNSFRITAQLASQSSVTKN